MPFYRVPLLLSLLNGWDCFGISTFQAINKKPHRMFSSLECAVNDLCDSSPFLIIHTLTQSQESSTPSQPLTTNWRCVPCLFLLSHALTLSLSPVLLFDSLFFLSFLLLFISASPADGRRIRNGNELQMYKATHSH